MAMTRREWVRGVAAAGMVPMAGGAWAQAGTLKISHQFPGGTATDMAATHAASYTTPSLRGVEPERIMKSVYALGRRAEPDEIAAIAAFLLSDEASYITGATVDASGGRM